jgi:DnaJ-class molecular chaperone
MKTEDCYRLLGVSSRSSGDEIKRSYKGLAKKYHPDNKETGDAVMFKKITEAFQLLSNRKACVNSGSTCNTDSVFSEDEWSVILGGLKCHRYGGYNNMEEKLRMIFGNQKSHKPEPKSQYSDLMQKMRKAFPDIDKRGK